jgi:hypothetical protein
MIRSSNGPFFSISGPLDQIAAFRRLLTIQMSHGVTLAGYGAIAVPARRRYHFNPFSTECLDA